MTARAAWPVLVPLFATLGAALPACGDDDVGGYDPGTPDAAATTPDAGAPDAEVHALTEQGVAECYAALHGDLSQRGPSLTTLRAAVAAEPDDARAHLFLGMCALAALVEDQNLGALADIEPSLTRAAELAPDDTRIPGWLGVYQVNLARTLGQGVDDAVAQMRAAAALYPEFNNVSLAIALSPFPLDTGYPAEAVTALETIADCGDVDPRCRNIESAPHNVSGSLMLFGDVHARVGNENEARAYYEAALADPGAATWPYRDLAQAALDDLDARIAAWADDDDGNDPVFFAASTVACRGCHE